MSELSLAASGSDFPRAGPKDRQPGAPLPRADKEPESDAAPAARRRSRQERRPHRSRQRRFSEGTSDHASSRADGAPLGDGELALMGRGGKNLRVFHAPVHEPGLPLA